ncbi:MAG: hypothetical protein EHM72_05050, partial [Calditrichaeota bacterium]
MKINSLPLALLAMLIFMSSAVQAAEIGRPLMTTYGAQKTNGHFQNWAFIQDQRGIMYVGNGFGVQEFDGSSWRMIVSPNRSFARSFAQDSSGRIYVGSGAELGYLETDDSEVKYVSLLNFIDEKERSFTTIASVQVTPEGIYFLAFEKLFRFRRTSSPISQDEKRDTWDVKVWSSQTSYRSAFWVDHNLYVSQIGSGLLKLQNDSLRLVPGSEQFKDDRIRFILPFPQLSHTHLVAAGRNGLFLWDGQTFEKFSTEADDVMRDAIIYDGVLLPDSCFAVSTLSEGFFILSSTGKIISHFTKDSGLISNTIQALYVDRQQNLWVGMDGGIAILEYHSPLSQFTTPTGIIPNSILRYDDQLYAACNYGVYVLDQDSEFRPVTLMSHSAEQVFQLYQVKKELFACMGSGIAAIKDKNAWLVYRDVTVTASCLYACWQDSSTILVGTSNGAIIFRQDARNPYQLDYVSRIAGLDEYVYTITEQEPGIFWLGTFDEGAIRIKAPDGDLTDAVIERFGPEHNLPAGTVMAYRAAGRLFFTTSEGVFRFDEQRQQFEPDPLFAKVNLGMNSAEGVIVGDSKGNIWANLGSETVIIKKNADGSYQLEKQTLSRFADEPVFSIYPEKDGTTWFGAVNRLLQYAPIDDREMIRPVASLIRKVVVPNDSTLFYGGKSAENSIKRLPFKLNELHFEYALPSFIYPDANEFQTKLEGFDRHWSEWSRENRRYYTNIPAGEYRFIVKARNINHQESESAVYAFTILRPWYSTLWAWVLYLMCGGGFIYLLVQMRTRQLRQRSRALEKIVQERTTEIQSQKNNVEQLSLIG